MDLLWAGSSSDPRSDIRLAKHPANANCESVSPASFASGLSSCTALSSFGFMKPLMNSPIRSLVARVPAGGG
jgi:hypothetical protein